MKRAALSLVVILSAVAGVCAQSSSNCPVVKGALKPGGPPALSVYAKNLSTGRLSVTFTYFSNTNSKLEQLKCSGSLPEIEEQVRVYGERNSMPAAVQDLFEAALQRLRHRQAHSSSPASDSK
jgi:hypothetical protein